jgi:uncharacterized membrane protein YphA (DoxX/SURF4 family)
MGFVILIGRVLWSAIFLGSAMGHLTQTDAMAGYAQSKRVPNPRFAVQATGAFLVLSALMAVLGVFADLAFLLQAIYLIAVAVLMHDFWRAGDEQSQMMEMVQFNKNLSLAGAALARFALFSIGGGAFLDFTITDSVFDWTP